MGAHSTVAFCHRHGIAVTAYCSMGGIESKAHVLHKEELQQIGSAHGKTPSQLLLRWAIQKNLSVIPGTGNPRHMETNLDVYDFQLSEQDIAAMSSVQNTSVLRAG